MSELRVSRDARHDLGEIHFHIAKDDERAADRLVAKLLEKAALLAEGPGLGEACEELAPGLRRFAVGKYIIFYRAISGGIEVARVLHGMQDIPRIFKRGRDGERG